MSDRAHTRFDVTTVRWIDGHRIELHHDGAEHRGLSAADVLVLHVEQECLPGELIGFYKRDHPRPWERTGAADDPQG